MLLLMDGVNNLRQEVGNLGNKIEEEKEKCIYRQDYKTHPAGIPGGQSHDNRYTSDAPEK